MKTYRLSVVLALGCILVAAQLLGATRKVQPTSPVPTSRDAMRLLKTECFACHNSEKKKGGLVLVSRERLLEGGDDGAVVVLGKPESSLLAKVVLKDADPHMPPKKQLTDAQIKILRDWIKGGLIWNEEALNEEDAIVPVELGSLPATYRPVLSITLSSDGRKLAVGRAGSIVIHDASKTNFPVLAQMEAHRDAVQALAWSSDGQWLASGAFRRVILWKGESSELAREWTNGLIGCITALKFAPEGDKLVVADGTGTQNGFVRVFSATDGKVIGSWRAHDDTIFDMDFSRDGQQLATAGGDKLIKVWELSSKKELARLEGHAAQVLGVAFNTNATQIVSAGADKQLKVWDIKTREKIISLGNHSVGITAVAWPRDGTAIVAATDNGGIFTYKNLKEHTGEQSSATADEKRIGDAAEALLCLAATSDGKTIFAGSQDGTVKIWSSEGKLLFTLNSPSDEPMRAAAPIAAGQSNQAMRNSGNVKGKPQNLRAMKGASQVKPLTDEILSLRAEPEEIHLSADALRHGVLITARVANGFELDVTDYARFSASPRAPFEVDERGEVRAVRPGQGVLTARVKRRRLEIPVKVVAATETDTNFTPSTVSFVRDVLPALSKAGCNGGACHAKGDGQNGFKLSVFSYDPKSDFAEIVKEDRGRRIFPAAPDESLIIRKPTTALPHEGGLRFERGSETHQLLVRWLREGMAYSLPEDPTLQRITAFPRERRYRKGATQRVLVEAHYSDGSIREVTRLAAFDSNDKEIANVDERGVITVGTLTGQGVVVARYMGFMADSQILVPVDRLLPEAKYAVLPRNNFIDELAYAHFQELGLYPTELCTDAEFVRRAYLDAIGKLPTAEEVRTFLASIPLNGESDKALNSHSPSLSTAQLVAQNRRAARSALIEKLLARPEYADYWANKWADLLRPNPDRVGVKSVFMLDQWLRESFRQNKSYDQFVREILLTEGTNHRDGPAVIYRDRREPPELTTMFSQLFLGTRLECAKCHHHPNEKWSQDDFYQFAAFFGSVKQKGAGLSPPISAGTETFYFAPGGTVKHPVTGAVMSPRPLDGVFTQPEKDLDPRRWLADWLTAPDNPFFARAAVNRVWANFFGRGLVEPVDDFRISNPCVNPPLLSALADDFAKHGYDLKHLMRTIMESHLYQLSSTPNESNLTDTRNFSRAYRRRLPAEVLLDAVNDVTGVPDSYAAMPVGSRATQAWSYKIESQFMDAFSRPNPSSDPPCERDRQMSVVQSLHLMNSKALQAKLSSESGRAHRLADSSKSPDEIATELYLATLSRQPTNEELKLASAAFDASGATRQTATEDLLWALLNSAEFVFNH